MSRGGTRQCSSAQLRAKVPSREFSMVGAFRSKLKESCKSELVKEKS